MAGSFTTNEALHRREASLPRRAPSCDTPATASKHQPAFAWHARARHCARCLSGGSAARGLAARARRAALAVADPRTRLRHCAGKRPLSFGARLWYDMSATASKNQQAFAWHARARTCARCPSGGSAARKLAARARRAALKPVGSLRTRHCTRGRPLSPGARPWCDTPATASNNQLAFAWHMRVRNCARCLSGGSTTRELAACERRVAQVVASSCTIKGHCTDEKPPSLGARLCFDMPGTASKNQPAFVWHARARYCARCLSGRSAARKLSERACRAALVVIGLCTRPGHCSG